MPTVSPLQEKLLQCLKEARLEEADRLLGAGASLSAAALAAPNDALSQYDARERLILAAGQASTAASLNWLIARNPELLPSGPHAVTLLARALEGTQDVRAPWFMDWLAEHTPLGPTVRQSMALNRKPMSSLVFKALNRNNNEGLAWLLRPPRQFPVWTDDPSFPVLIEALREGTGFDYVARRDRLVFLMKEGVKPGVKPDPAHPESPCISPLQELLCTYANALDLQHRFGTPLKAGLEALVIALWPLLVQAGDNPHRRLANGKTPREMITGTPVEGVALAWERHAAIPVAQPVRARRRALT